ncbi:MAG: hypothetical protein ABI769_08520 [Pseudomonadota bacterium]
MEVHVTDDQIGRYFRRIQLGLRLLTHGARAQTTCLWSGLTPDQLITLRRRWMFDGDDRLRGPSPSSFEIFFSSDRVRNQAALFACICRIAGVKHGRASLEDGERLCEAFEIFREWEPESRFDFEQLVLLMTGSIRREKIELTRCGICAVTQVIDKYGVAGATCRRCRRDNRRRGRSKKRVGASPAYLSGEQSDQAVVEDQDEAAGERGEHHQYEREARSGSGDFEGDRGTYADDHQNPERDAHNRLEKSQDTEQG